MKKTILLVEDSKVQKLACERVLFKAGYLVLFAGDGEEALRLARESVPDLVLLDLLLPGIGGGIEGSGRNVRWCPIFGTTLLLQSVRPA